MKTFRDCFVRPVKHKKKENENQKKVFSANQQRKFLWQNSFLANL